MDSIELSASELIFMASYLGADEFYGIPNPFFGMSERETQAALADAQVSLAEKRYAELDFDGNFSPGGALEHLASVCSNCDCYVSVNIMEYGNAQTPVCFYFWEGSVAKLSGGDVLKLESFATGQVESELLALAEKYAPARCDPAQEPVSVPLSAVTKAQVESDEAEKQCVALVSSGCPRYFAGILAAGLQSQADYCSLVLTDFVDKRVDSIIWLRAGDGALRMVPVEAGGADCWALSQIDARSMQEAITAMMRQTLGNDANPGERGEF